METYYYYRSNLWRDIDKYFNSHYVRTGNFDLSNADMTFYRWYDFFVNDRYSPIINKDLTEEQAKENLRGNFDDLESCCRELNLDIYRELKEGFKNCDKLIRWNLLYDVLYDYIHYRAAELKGEIYVTFYEPLV